MCHHPSAEVKKDYLPEDLRSGFPQEITDHLPAINQGYLTLPQAVSACADRRYGPTQLPHQAEYRLTKQKEQAFYPELAQLTS